MADFFKKALLRFARAEVDRVIGKLTQQVNIVEELAHGPMRAMVKEVEGGQLWRGRGADAFVRDVSTMMVPGVGKIKDQVQTFQGNLQRASQTIEQADQQAQRLINECVDKFDTIYRDK